MRGGQKGHPWAGRLGTRGKTREKKKGVPGGRGLIVLMGGVQKAHQKRGLGGHHRLCFLHQGTVLERAWCRHLPAPGTGEPVTHKPLAQPHLKHRCQSTPLTITPFPRAHLASLPLQGTGLSYSLLLSNMLQAPAGPSTSGLGSHGKGRVGMGVRRSMVQLLPPLKIQKQKSASKVK